MQFKKNMKNLLLILALFVGNSFAEDKNKNDATQSIYLGQLKGEMNFNCVVKDQIILTIQDGTQKVEFLYRPAKNWG